MLYQDYQRIKVRVYFVQSFRLTSSQSQNTKCHRWGDTDTFTSVRIWTIKKLISNSNGLVTDPLTSVWTAVWGLSNQTSKNSQDYVFASMVYNALNGNAGNRQFKS